MVSADRFYVGVDVGRRQHSVAILPCNVAARGWERAPVDSFSADVYGFEKLFTTLDRVGATPEVTECALEATGGYYSQAIFQGLKRRGYSVLWVRNQAVHDLRETVYYSGPKILDNFSARFKVLQQGHDEKAVHPPVQGAGRARGSP